MCRCLLRKVLADWTSDRRKRAEEQQKDLQHDKKPSSPASLGSRLGILNELASECSTKLSVDHKSQATGVVESMYHRMEAGRPRSSSTSQCANGVPGREL